MKLKTLKSKLLVVGLLTGALAITEDFTSVSLIGESFIFGTLIGEAEAHFQRGRGGRGGSRARGGRRGGGSQARGGRRGGARVAHRSSRRFVRRGIRRSTIYRASLPRSCFQTTINSALLWHCGNTYYQPYGTQYVVVYVD